MLNGWSRVFLLSVSLIVLFSFMSVTAQAGDEKFKETYEARAVSMGVSNPPTIPIGARATLQINITRWSTEKERTNLLTQLRDNGQKGLNTTLAKQEETGWVRVTSVTQGDRYSAPSERLRYAREIVREDGARRIVLALDRTISFVESATSPRWRDHDVTMIIMDVDKNGVGEGQLALGVAMELDDKNNLKIENYGTEPVRLTHVKKR